MNDVTPASFSGNDLACRRGGRAVFSALHFTLASGDILFLRGANGSGKSTLLRVMAGLAPVSRGQLVWNGAPISDLEIHSAHVRFIGHLDAIKPALTVAENLAFWRRLWGGTGDDRAIEQAAETLGLARLLSFPARLLSAGQRRRLALARLIVAPALLWLLDEPDNALDEASRRALATMIAAHRGQGGMAVIASHGAETIEGAQNLNLDRFAHQNEAHWSDAV